jgi:hypothetical protein
LQETKKSEENAAWFFGRQQKIALCGQNKSGRAQGTFFTGD